MSFLRGFVFAVLACLGVLPAWALERCQSTSLRYGVEASEWAALNRAEEEFLGPFAASVGGGSGGFSRALDGGTRVDMRPTLETQVGYCGPLGRITLRLSQIAVYLPEGIDVFTDPAQLSGWSLGLRGERQFWQPLGAWRAGLGIGLAADWQSLQLRSALLDVKSRDFSVSLPVTLRLSRKVRWGEVDLWLRQSWGRGGTEGLSVGLGLHARF